MTARAACEVRQLAVGGLDRNFSYLVVERASREAALIDPAGDAGVIRRAVEDAGPLRPRAILLTHCHRDHCDGAAAARAFFDAPVAAHPACAYPHEIDLEDRGRLPLGGIEIECLHAPGHSADSVVYRLSDDTALFTGDTLFIDWCGYCDPAALFRTMRDVLRPLADTNEVYPGHDYGRFPHAALGAQKRENPYLAATEFARFREELKRL
ncbi:MAG: MBL fold metallo-hydrolase [bacterium]|nr:MBL fold metallo-hydrolase [bacterium]